MYSLQSGKLCFCPAYVWWMGAKYFGVRKIIDGSFGEESEFVFIVLCGVCWL